MALETHTISRRPGSVAKLVVREHSLYPTSYPQTSSRLHASMAMLPDVEKEAAEMCVVLIGRQKEGLWHWKHARYKDAPEQSQSQWCNITHRTQRRTHQLCDCSGPSRYCACFQRHGPSCWLPIKTTHIVYASF